MSGVQAMMLPDGRRLHLNHGPIDLVIEAFGPGDAVREGYARAMARFDGLLEGLVAELPGLRSGAGAPLFGPVARAMGAAVAPYRPAFITPMAAVAGAVADAVLAALVAGGDIRRAYVNNGGDIALHLTSGESLTAAIALPGSGAGRVVVAHGDPSRGIATSGWRGRSQSFGIADAVTVLARDAAMADAAATMIANAVDLPGDPAIRRRPAHAVKADSDLGHRPVTVAVGPLDPASRARALDRGLAAARLARERGLIVGAALFLQGEVRTLGHHARSLSQAETEPCLG